MYNIFSNNMLNLKIKYILSLHYSLLVIHLFAPDAFSSTFCVRQSEEQKNYIVPVQSRYILFQTDLKYFFD